MSSVISRKSGFTLIEIVIAMAISVGLLLVVSHFVSNYFKQSARQAGQIENLSSKQLTLRFLWKDMNNLFPSYNNLKNNHNNFFSYLPGCPTDNFSGSKVSLELSESGKKEVSFYVWDNAHPKPIVYLPVHAYKIGERPSDQNSAATLSFIGLNKDNILAKMNSQVWKDGQSLLLYSPAWLRYDVSKPCATNPYFPKQPAFLGKISGNKMAKSSSLFDYSDPLDRNYTYKSTDDFLRRLPPVGGSMPMLLIRPLKKVSYQLVTNDPSNGNKTTLYRIEFIGDTEKLKMPLAIDVKSLRLERDSLEATTIKISIELNEGAS